MKHDKRTQKRPPRQTGLLHTLFAKPKRLPATAVQEHDWDSDVPGIKLSTAFMVILFLHVAVVGGVMLFRFLEKDSDAALAGVEAGKSPAAQTTAAGGEGIRLDDPSVAHLPKHLVRPHETLDMIATAHGVTRDALIRTNRLNAENSFRQGMTLVIPPPEAGAARVAESSAPRGSAPVAVARAVEVANPAGVAAAPVEPRVASARPVSTETTTRAVTTETTSGYGREHVVKSGETVWAISKKYGVSVADVLKANNLKDASKVRIGAKLRIPAGN
jgi:LysM repeat protein